MVITNVIHDSESRVEWKLSFFQEATFYRDLLRFVTSLYLMTSHFQSQILRGVSFNLFEVHT